MILENSYKIVQGRFFFCYIDIDEDSFMSFVQIRGDFDNSLQYFIEFCAQIS